MKAIFFLKPLEWKIEATGEQWAQGSTIKGQVIVTNHGSDEINLQSPQIEFAVGDYKKIEAKDDKAFQIVESVKATDEKKLSPKESFEFPFEFKIGHNAKITDKKTGVFMAVGCGKIESHMEVTLKPVDLYAYFIDLIDKFHRFKVKEYKNAKKGVEYKLIPPPSREYASLDHLVITLSLDETKTLSAIFSAKLKKLELTTIATTVAKEVKEFAVNIPSKEYLLGRDNFDQDKLLAVLTKVTDEVKLKKIF